MKNVIMISLGVVRYISYLLSTYKQALCPCNDLCLRICTSWKNQMSFISIEIASKI